MNHSSYVFYITKSCEAARLISVGLSAKREGESFISTGSGSVGQDCRIPAIYHNCGYFYAYAEYKNGEDWNSPKYELIIC